MRYVNVRRGHARAVLEVATDDEATAVWEVWTSNDYPITPQLVGGQLVVDVGANVGAFTVLAAKMGAQVLAYEPHPETVHRLERNVARNRVEGRVTLVRKAVFPGVGFVVLEGEGGAAHVVAANEGNVGVCVPAIAPDDAIPEGTHLVKMDCEGAEYDILGTLTHWPAYLFAEWHGPGMPHLAHLDPTRWSTMVTQLADRGRLTTVGHPSVGGLLTWQRY